MTTTVPRRPSRPAARTPRVDRVAVEFTRTSAAQLGEFTNTAGLGRGQVAELARLESRVLDHLARTPAARQAMLTDPASVLRTAAPDASPPLVEAVASTQAKAARLPTTLHPDQFRYGVAGRVPLPRFTPAAVTPTAAPGSLGGFDACLAVGAGALGRALADLLGPLLGPRLLELAIPVVGTLRVNALTFAPNAVIDAANGRVRIEVTADAELEPLVGPTIALTLVIGIDVTIAADGALLTIDQIGVTLDVQVLGVNLPLNILDAIVGAVTDAVRSVFPQTRPVDLPGGNPDFCDIGLRDLATGFLGGTPGTTDPCLAVLTGLLSDTATDIGALASPLPAGKDGGVFLDNFFLLTEIACEVQHSPQLPGLPDPPTHVPQRTDPAAFFEWDDAELEQEVGGEKVVISRVRLEIDPTVPERKSFVVSADLTIKRKLFEADVTLRVPVGLTLAGGEITPVVDAENSTFDVTIRLTALGIFLGIVAGVVLAVVIGVVAGLIAGITAALVAGGIAAGVYAVVVVLIIRAIRRAVGNAIADAVAGQTPAGVRVIPQPIVELFGVLDIVDLVFDDLELIGTLTAVPPDLTLRKTVQSPETRVVSSGPNGVVQDIATTVRFDTVGQKLAEPVVHQWRFTTSGTPRPVPGGKVPRSSPATAGTVLVSGQLPPGSGISAVAIDAGGDTCRITNAFGSDVAGTVTVQATDALGTSLTRSTGLTLTGRITIPIDDMPGPKPDPRFPEQP